MRPPSDHVGEEDSFVITIINKLFFILTFMPIKFGWIVRLAKRRKVNYCPNCGLPLMVKLKSDAGWVAKRKNDIKAGLISVEAKPQAAVAFGRTVVLPGDEENAVIVPAPKLEKLPDLSVLLAEPENTGEPAVEPAKNPDEPKQKKPVDPDAW